MVRGASASATWRYTTTAPQGTIAAVHGMHQKCVDWNRLDVFFYPKKMVRPSMLILETSKKMTASFDFLLVFGLISLPSGKQTWQWKVAPVSFKGGEYILKWSIFDIFWDFG